MIANMEKISQRLEDLTKQSQQLGESMRQSARQLQDDGIIPEISLIEEIQSFEKQLQETSQSLAKEVDTKSLSEEPLSIEKLRTAIDQLLVRDRANQVLDQIPLIVHRDDDKFLPLQECCTVASLLKENLQSLSGEDIPPEMQNVLDGKHALCALLALVQTPDDLDDEIWSQHNESLTVAFGRQLATAVARGKLIMRDANDSEKKNQTKTTKGKKGNRLESQKTK